MKKWLMDLFSRGSLLPEAEEYLLSRGGKRETIESLGIISWDSVPPEKSPDPVFNEKYFVESSCRLTECILTPYWSLKNEIIGFEARKYKIKWITDFRVSPDIDWCTFWIGSNQDSLEKLWRGGSAWIVEGLFDLFALDWVIPTSDVILVSVQARLVTKHIEYLRRFTKFVHLCMDMDKPGRDGVYKAARLLREESLQHRVVKYGPGKDPGEIWDRGGAEELREIFL